MGTDSNIHIGRKIDSSESLIFQLTDQPNETVPRSNYKASISKGIRVIETPNPHESHFYIE